MRRSSRVVNVLLVVALTAIAAIALAADVGPGSTPTVGTPVMFTDASGKARFATNGLGGTATHLSANGGDTLSLSAPTNGSTEGYALLPSYTAARITFSDGTASRTVTKWVQDSLSGVWHAAGQITTTAVAGNAGDTVFDQTIIVGNGRLYFQIVDVVGTPLKVDFVVETR